MSSKGYLHHHHHHIPRNGPRKQAPPSNLSRPFSSQARYLPIRFAICIMCRHRYILYLGRLAPGISMPSASGSLRHLRIWAGPTAASNVWLHLPCVEDSRTGQRRNVTTSRYSVYPVRRTHSRQHISSHCFLPCPYVQT